MAQAEETQDSDSDALAGECMRVKPTQIAYLPAEKPRSRPENALARAAMTMLDPQ